MQRTLIKPLLLLACLLALLLATLPLTAQGGDLMLYNDALQNGFQDWSWADHDLNNPSPVFEGQRSVRVNYDGNYEGLWFVHPGTGVSTNGYDALRFAIHGGDVGGQQIEIKAGAGQTFPSDNLVLLTDYLPGGPVAGQWREVIIPLADLNLSDATLGNLAFQSRVNGAEPTFYIDDIRLVSSSGPSATPTPQGTPGSSTTLTIDPTAPGIDLNPLLRGSNLPAWLGPQRLENATFRARTVASGVTMLRLPGGSYSNNYNWLACENGDAGNCIVGDWGATPTDFLNFLKATGKQGLWVVSPNGTPQEAAALVAFFNADIGDTTPIGADRNGVDWQTVGTWAQLRASHGNPDPYPIAYWEVGNEVYGGKSTIHPQCAPWGWEEVWTCDGTEYMNGIAGREGYLAFREEMRTVDSSISVGAVGIPHPSEWTNWGNEVIAAGGNTMDFYSLHFYAFDNAPSIPAALAAPITAWPTIRNDLNVAFDTYNGGNRRPVAVTEYNLIAVGDNDTGQLMTRAANLFYIADSLGQMASQGMFMAHQWDLANGRAGSGSDYGLMTDDTFSRYPQYYAFPLWARFGQTLLPVSNPVPADTTLSVYAGRVDGDTLSLLAINKTGQAIGATVQASGTSFTGGVGDTVRANSLEAQTVTFNGNANPADDLSNAPSQPVSANGGVVTHTFPPYSVTLLRLDTGAAGPTMTPTPPGATATPTIAATPVNYGQDLYLPLLRRDGTGRVVSRRWR